MYSEKNEGYEISITLKVYTVCVTFHNLYAQSYQKSTKEKIVTIIELIVLN